MKPTQSAFRLALTTFLPLCSAQSSRDCPGISSLSFNASINSTGTQPFQLGSPFRDWYLTMTLNDTRSPNLRVQLHDLQGWISAPEDVIASACVYLLPGLDVQASDAGGASGCDGALSTGCREWLRREIGERMDVGVGSTTCPRLPERELIRENCPDEVALGGLWGRDDAVSLWSKNCSVALPAGPFNAAIPSEYRTHPVFGYRISFEGADQAVDNFTYYDRYVRQVRPWIVAARAPREGGVQLETKVVCVAPDEVVRGSRVPVGEWSSGKESMGRKMVGNMMFVFVMVALALVW